MHAGPGRQVLLCLPAQLCPRPWGEGPDLTMAVLYSKLYTTA